jgi:hypothetical protein
MDTEKTIEELKVENELLSKQIQDINNNVKKLSEVLIDAKERNLKLAYSVRLFAETHLTREEKIAIAKEFDMAVSADQVEKIYTKYRTQVQPEGIEMEQDMIWSPGFTRDLEKYFFNIKGFNPFESIDTSIKTIRLQFKIEDDIRVTEDPEKLKILKESWKRNREASLQAVDEILGITHEILHK